jgi:hypothetical protein
VLLQRFVTAQAVAFRKILKKYRRWTGSSTVGCRFNSTSLSHRTNFTRQTYSLLYAEYNGLLSALETASLEEASPVLPRSCEWSFVDEGVPVKISEQNRYWNEYDDGSDAGDVGRIGTDESDPLLASHAEQYATTRSSSSLTCDMKPLTPVC